jgi:hypothetical protein
MESISVYLGDLKPILQEIQRREIGLKIQNHRRSLSDHFYTLAEIKEFKEHRLTVLILFDPANDDSTVIDVKSIRGLELKQAIRVGTVMASVIRVKQ